MTDQAIEPYFALPLQMRCDAINLASNTAAARQSIMDSIHRCADTIASSIGFCTTFNGVSVKLVVLPEYFLTGFPMGESVAQWIDKACIRPGGAEYEALAQIAVEKSIFLSGNAYEVDENFEQLYFQTSFIIDPNGEVVLRYRRLISMYSPTPHDVLDLYLEHYGEESLFPVVDTEIGRLACVASEEILYPEISRALTLRGAEVLCHSSSEISSFRSTPKNIAKQARAYENMAYVVSANSAAIGGLTFPAGSTDGHSQIVCPEGRVLAEAAVGESTVGGAEIDIDSLRRIRAKPAMKNLLARQRLELFKATYADSVYAANSLLVDGKVVVPDRSHYMAMQSAAIKKLTSRE